MFGKKEYIKTTAKDGSTIYTTKKQFAKAAERERIRRENLPTGSPDGTVSAEVGRLMNLLGDKVKYLKRIQMEASDPKKRQEKGTQFKGRMDDMKNTKTDIDKCVKDLYSLGVKVNKDALKRGKVVYEGGHDIMLTTNEIKSMKLDVFEENSKGLISNELRDYMLTVLESVSGEIERLRVFNEKVNEKIDAQRERFNHFITESFNAGLITSTQYEVFAEMANDNFLFDVAMPDQLPGLVSSYLEAAKENDEVKKAEIKAKIDEANEMKALESGNEVVTEGADCSIVEKLESLKIKLSDEEKEMAEKFDQLIADAMNKDDKKEEPASEEPAEGEPSKEEPVKEGAEEKVEEPKADEPAKEDKGGKGEEEPVTEEPAGEEPSGEEPVEEGVENTIVSGFDAVVCESSLTEDEANDVISFMTEAVNDNVYSEDDLARVRKMIGV